METLPNLNITDAQSRSGAAISQDGKYRYALWRKWAPGPVCPWIMLNPSTADATQDDPTIRRCLGYARDWGFSGIVVVNLFSLRATDPAELRAARDPIGPETAMYHWNILKLCSRVVCAWGAHGSINGRGREVKVNLNLIGVLPYVLKLTKGGEPAHPLYLKGNLIPEPWDHVRVWGPPAG